MPQNGARYPISVLRQSAHRNGAFQFQCQFDGSSMEETQATAQPGDPKKHIADNLTDTPAGTEPTQPDPGPEEALTQTQAKLAELQEEFLRAKAETENVRRRAKEEIDKAHK